MFLNPPIKYHYLPRSLAWLVLAAGASRSSAQSDYLEQSLPDLTMPHLKYVELNVEAEQSGLPGAVRKPLISGCMWPRRWGLVGTISCIIRIC